MRTTIDKAGRLVIPKPLRDQVGFTSGPVEVVVDGSGIRIEPVGSEDLVERQGRLVVRAAGVPVDDDLVVALRDADRD